MKGVHRKIPETNISPPSILKPPSILHPKSKIYIMTTHHIVSQITAHYDPMTNTSPSPQQSAIHNPYPIQPSKHRKYNPIFQKKIGIKIDSQLLGKPPKVKDLLLLLLRNPQEAPPNKICEHCTLLTAC